MITTPIGSEGMEIQSLLNEQSWGGIIGSNPNELAEATIRLYTNKSLWEKCTETGKSILSNKFDWNFHQQNLMNKLLLLQENQEIRKKRDWKASILFSGGLRYTKYMAKYIEESRKRS